MKKNLKFVILIFIIVTILLGFFYWFKVKPIISKNNSTKYFVNVFKNENVLGYMYGNSKLAKDDFDKIVLIFKVKAGIEEDFDNWVYVPVYNDTYKTLGNDIVAIAMNCFENKNKKGFIKCYEETSYFDSDCLLGALNEYDKNFADENAKNNTIGSCWFPIKSYSYSQDDNGLKDKKYQFFWNGGYDYYCGYCKK